MATVIVTNIVSLDGFDSDLEGNPTVLEMEDAFNSYNLERIRSAATVLLGATSYRMFSSYWPHIADAPAEPGNPALDETNREISRIYNELPKVVVSDSYEPPADNPWHDTTRRVRRDEVGSWLAETDGEVLVFGSRTMWNGLLRQGLVDELHLMVSPRTLGTGRPVFEVPTELRLLGSRTFEGSPNVLLRYAPA